MNPILQKKVERAVRLIQSVKNVGGQPIEVAYSGGKDSDVILELVRMSGVEYRAIYKCTTIDPPGTIKHCEENGVEIMRPKESFFKMMRDKGIPNRYYRFCCSTLKEYPVLYNVVIGVRTAESRKRAERYKEPVVCRVFNKTKDIREQQIRRTGVHQGTRNQVAPAILPRGWNNRHFTPPWVYVLSADVEAKKNRILHAAPEDVAPIRKERQNVP